MITLQRSNPTVTQILAAHGCQTTALQDRYDIHTYVFSSACLQLRLSSAPLGHRIGPAELIAPDCEKSGTSLSRLSPPHVDTESPFVIVQNPPNENWGSVYNSLVDLEQVPRPSRKLRLLRPENLTSVITFPSVRIEVSSLKVLNSHTFDTCKTGACVSRRPTHRFAAR
jgi:hypothetical protein